MRISQLAERTGLTVATIKFYLREGLLHPGEATGATRATYDESHVRRLRLIRALVDVGGLSLDAVRETLAAVADEQLTLHEVVGTAAARLSPERKGTPPDAATLRRVDRLMKHWRWRVTPETSHRLALAQALDALAGLDQPLSDETLTFYAEAMRTIAEREVGSVPVGARERATEYVVIGTLLVEPVLLSLRRLAHTDLSRRRLGKRRKRA